MLDRVLGMQVFQKVASTGSLSAAARSLGMSPTMATKHVAALEARLGTRLMHRTTRRLTLTGAGRGYLDAAERILAQIDEAEAAASRSHVEARGTLRLNAPVSFGILEIAPLLPAFCEANPHLLVDLGLNDRQVDLIEEGWDLAVRIGTMKGAGIRARRLAPCPLVVCAAPAYIARAGAPRRVADLSQHNCLGYTLSSSVGHGSWAFGRDGATTVKVQGTLQANNGDALVAAALGGLGIIYQPAFLVRRWLDEGKLVALDLDHRAIEMGGVYAVYPGDRSPPAKVRVMIDFLAAQFAAAPASERHPIR